MDYIEMGFSNHILSISEFKKQTLLIKIGCVLQIIIISLIIIMNIIFAILFETIDTVSYDFINMYYIITSSMLQLTSIVLTIGSIVVLIIGFFKLSETFNDEIQNKMRLSMIFLITYIAFSQLFLVGLNFLTNYLFFFNQSRIAYYGITNILKIGVLIAAFVLMDQTVQKTYGYGMQKKRRVDSSYNILTIGIILGIYNFIYLILDLPFYSATIVQSIFTIVVIIGFIEYIMFLNSFHMKLLPFEKLVIEQNAMIHQKEI